MAIGLPLYLRIWTRRLSTSSSRIVADGVGAQRERLEALLIHEVEAVAIGIQERRGDLDQIGLGKLLAGLEGLVEHRTRQQVPHLQAHERLAAARGRARDLEVDADVGRVFELEERLPLDLDGFYQAGHIKSVSEATSIGAPS